MSQLELLRAYKEKFNVYVKTAEPHQYVKLMILDMMLQKTIQDVESGKLLNDKNLEALKHSMKINCDIEVN